ncbi:MAG: metallophosphoesterase [Bacilli bacterium]|nr:metallophosphoesterase [Bacilli bacterium]
MVEDMWIIYLLLALVIIVVVYALFEKSWMKLKTYYVKINRPNLKGLRIAFISDLHHSEYVSIRYLKKVVERVNSLKTDVIILGGDYVSSKEKYIEPVFSILKDLKAPLGVYGVIGNHDFEAAKAKVLQAMQKAGIISLDNESYWLKYNNDKFKLGGIADIMYDLPNINKTIHDVENDDYVILVSHNPDYAEVAKDYPVDLMVSGHTHGGQITLFGLYAPVIPSKYKQKYRSGLIKHGRLHTIVSHGVGVVGLPFRFFARPEITIIEFTD